MLNENIKDDEPEDEDKIPKFKYKHADWEAYRAFLISSDINSITNEDIHMYYSNFTKTVLLAAEQSIPRIKNKKIRERSGNPWWNQFCKQAVFPKKEQFKKWLKNKTEENFVSTKSAKIQCNRVTAEAKKSYWTEFCKILEYKDMYKVWKKVKEMENGYKLQAYPIKLESNDFPSGQDKAEAFVNLHAEYSLSSNLNPSIIKFRKEEEKEKKKKEEEYKDAVSNQCHYLNSLLQHDEFIETLESFVSNSTAAGIDGISYQMLNHLPDSWKQLLHAFYQKCWLNETLPSIWKQSVIIPILKQGKPK